MLTFLVVNPRNILHATYFVKIRNESLIEDVLDNNLLTYPEEESLYTPEGYVKGLYLKGYVLVFHGENVIRYGKSTQIWHTFQGRHNFSIGPVYISKAFRNQGIGMKLMQFIENTIQNSYKNFERFSLHLSVNSNNTPAIFLYNSIGFSVVGTKKDYIHTREGKYSSVLDMAKIIQNDQVP